MKQLIVHVALVVRDYDEAMAFFRDKLHFVVVENVPVPEQQKRWVVVALPGSTGTSQVLARPSKPGREAYIGHQAGAHHVLPPHGRLLAGSPLHGRGRHPVCP